MNANDLLEQLKQKKFFDDMWYREEKGDSRYIKSDWSAFSNDRTRQWVQTFKFGGKDIYIVSMSGLYCDNMDYIKQHAEHNYTYYPDLSEIYKFAEEKAIETISAGKRISMYFLDDRKTEFHTKIRAVRKKKKVFGIPQPFRMSSDRLKNGRKNTKRMGSKFFQELMSAKKRQSRSTN